MNTPTSTITFDHDGVLVTDSGMVKIAETPGKFWRMWIYNDATDVWELQPEVFGRKRRADAEAAAAQVDQLLGRLSA